MNLTTIILILTASLSPLTKGANGLTIALVHPDSKALLEKYGENLPNDIAKDYQVLYERNTGIGADDKPSINGLVVAKNPTLTEKDFIGFETASDSWGNNAGVFHLKLASREVAAEFASAHSNGTIALVVDKKWVYYDTQIENIRAAAGFVAIPVLDKRDEDRFKNLVLGKRGAHLDDPLLSAESGSPTSPKSAKKNSK